MVGTIMETTELDTTARTTTDDGHTPEEVGSSQMTAGSVDIPTIAIPGTSIVGARRTEQRGEVLQPADTVAHHHVTGEVLQHTDTVAHHHVTAGHTPRSPELASELMRATGPDTMIFPGGHTTAGRATGEQSAPERGA
ncbi:hypothetical protein VZT92_027976 [Zoarces viviparus]|uniref:Uncharacterized protein n=1 Tax=Zoarces viviparus TaxID=48416 RepID=A0AAW1DW87_ZOAVI